jgi:predicted dehydrogenase/sugar lactone lactonase YvrE
MTVEAARSGIHVFCEKPMALSVAECRRMITAAKTAGVQLAIGHKRRFRPQYRRMTELIRSGTLGDILTVDINGYFHRDPQGWWARRETGGGLLYYSGVHDIDFLRSICGEAVSVFAGAPRKVNDATDFEDAISMTLQFESSVVATLQVSPLSPFASFRESFAVHIILEHGAILYDPGMLSVCVRSRSGASDVFHFDNEAGFREAYTIEFDNFARCVLNGDEPLVSGEDGLKCVEIMEAAGMSAYSGRTVRLPLPQTAGRPANRAAEHQLWAGGISSPQSPVFDTDGNLYVVDRCTSRVLSIGQNRVIQEFAKTDGQTQGVTISSSGDFYISDSRMRKIFRRTKHGVLSDFCTAYADGSALCGPKYMVFGPNDTLYFLDGTENRHGAMTLALARSDGRAERVLQARGLVGQIDCSPDEKAIYAADSAGHRILRAAVQADGALASSFSEFVRFEPRDRLAGLCFGPNGALYVQCLVSREITVVGQSRKTNKRIGIPGLFASGIAFHGGGMFVCEGQTGAIWRLPVDGATGQRSPR